jgi:hypothetical protein
MCLRSGLILLCGFWIAAAQADLAPEVVRLARIKEHMKERLLKVPNYTCLQTVERSERARPSAKFKVLDTIRLEVAEVKGKELFARPGQQFDQSNPGAFARGGAMASGLFVMFANALFVGDNAMHTYAGEEEIGDRKLLRYDFRVPQMRSGYNIRTPYNGAVVAYHGSFWADGESLDVLHLRIVAESIPPVLGLADSAVDIEYQTARIGGADALLPKLADMLLTEFSGVEKRNVTRFSGCRQYGSESVVSFETEADKPGK